MGTYSRYPPSGFSFGMSLTPGVKALLFANILIFVLTSFGVPLGLFFGLSPDRFIHGMVWQVFTYMFLHGNVTHILFNMLSLWMFGSVVEQTWGKRRFLRFY